MWRKKRLGSLPNLENPFLLEKILESNRLNYVVFILISKHIIWGVMTRSTKDSISIKYKCFFYFEKRPGLHTVETFSIGLHVTTSHVRTQYLRYLKRNWDLVRGQSFIWRVCIMDSCLKRDTSQGINKSRV